ncbi:MAG: pyridoxal-phosphate dependent enzyme [Dehalococcoidia bacterium]|nr:pyridoxal-phosphate dependent enzyme [Dehalococcoidia bacterium]
MVSLDDMRAAADVIAPNVHRTPITSSKYLGDITGSSLYLKLEMFQKTGSFKPRGVLNKMASLTDEEKGRGVVSLSAGNHAQALAYAATMAGAPSVIVMPEGAVRAKVEATRGYGGEVILTDQDLLKTALEVQRERGMTLVHPFDDLHTIAGTGTLGLELIEDIPQVDVVICGIGGGGLISGVAAALKLQNRGIRVIGVEPGGAPGMTLALEKGEPVHMTTLDTVADGLAAPFVGQHNLDHVRAFVDDVITVQDSQIVEGMRLLLERTKVLSEPAGAASLAALLSGQTGLRGGESVICVLSGGNVDGARLAELLG